MHYTISTIILVLAHLTMPCLGQNIFKGDLILSNQTEVNALDTLLQGISIIDGNVLVGSITQESNPIINLNTLIHIKEITGDLQIGGYFSGYAHANPALENLSGLDSITTIGKNFEIGANPLLKSMTGLENLSSIGNEFSIRNNKGLKSFDGLGKISSIISLNILENDSILNFKGFDNLAQIEICTVSDNLNLYSFQGFNKVHFIDGFNVDNNNALNDFTGLEALVHIGYLRVENNNSIKTFYGLQNVSNLNLELVVTENPKLLSLQGLENARPFYDTDPFEISIMNNLSLTDFCAITGLIENLTELNLNIINNAFDPDFESGACKPSSDIYNGSLYLTTQLQVEKVISFTDSNTIISGSIFIGSLIGEDDPITNLKGLSKIEEIRGSLQIGGYYNNKSWYNPLLVDLTGLNKLKTIEGNLFIYNTEGLINLKGLDNLSKVGNEITISDNKNLISLRGLSSLESHDWLIHIQNNEKLDSINLTSLKTCRQLYIDNNKNLKYINGLNNLANVKEVLEFEGNHSLLSLKGLESLVYVEGGLDLEANLSLETVDGLNNLQYIAGIYLTANNSLKTLSQLESLDDVGYSLRIIGNEKLENLNGLDKITKLGNELVVMDNPSLLSIAALNNITDINNVIYIENNASLYSLEGLNNLSSKIAYEFVVTNNASLKNFCALQHYFNTVPQTINISGNAYNPRKIDVINGECGYYRLAFNVTGNGKIEGALYQEVMNGDASSQVTAVPDENYKLVKWADESGNKISDANPFVILNISQDWNVNCVFELINTIKMEKDEDGILLQNPSCNGVIKVKVSQQASCNIYNQHGKKIRNCYLNPGTHTLNVETLKSGIYLMEFETGLKKIIKKLIVE